MKQSEWSGTIIGGLSSIDHPTTITTSRFCPSVATKPITSELPGSVGFRSGGIDLPAAVSHREALHLAHTLLVFARGVRASDGVVASAAAGVACPVSRKPNIIFVVSFRAAAPHPCLCLTRKNKKVIK